MFFFATNSRIKLIANINCQAEHTETSGEALLATNYTNELIVRLSGVEALSSRKSSSTPLRKRANQFHPLNPWGNLLILIILLIRFVTHIKSNFSSIYNISMFQERFIQLFSIQQNFTHKHIFIGLIHGFDFESFSIF